jgi:hypothetical protein
MTEQVSAAVEHCFCGHSKAGHTSRLGRGGKYWPTRRCCRECGCPNAIDAPPTVEPEPQKDLDAEEIAAIEEMGKAEETAAEPVMAWDGGHIEVNLAYEILHIVSKHASGKPATEGDGHSPSKYVRALPLPDGVTPEDAVEVIRWGIKNLKARKEFTANQRKTRALAHTVGLTVRARMKTAAKLLGHALDGAEKAEVKAESGIISASDIGPGRKYETEEAAAAALLAMAEGAHAE